jgi:hypothetical protein
MRRVYFSHYNLLKVPVFVETPAMMPAMVCVCVCCFKDIEKLPTKYDANTNSANFSMTIEDYCVQLGWKVGAQTQQILLFTDQCAAHSKNTTFLTDIKV